jgi:hypothetical protein
MKTVKNEIVLAHWTNSNYFPYQHKKGDAKGLYLVFRTADEAKPSETIYDEMTINLGLYIWLNPENKTFSFEFIGRDIFGMRGDKLIKLGRFVNSLNKKAIGSGWNFIEIKDCDELIRLVVSKLHNAGIKRAAIDNKVNYEVCEGLAFLRDAIERLYSL